MQDAIQQLRISSPSIEGPLRVSKWADIRLLVDEEEMQSLIAALHGTAFYATDRIVSGDDICRTYEQFLYDYHLYLQALKENRLDTSWKRPFQLALNRDPDALYQIVLEDGRRILKCCRPVIHMQGNEFSFSPVDRKIHTKTFGKKGVSWGIHLSYPNLFQDPKTHLAYPVTISDAFPNTALFRGLQKWMRENTLPTPFLIDGNRYVAPLRLGKRCFSWIGEHPQLQELPLTIGSYVNAH